MLLAFSLYACSAAIRVHATEKPARRGKIKSPYWVENHKPDRLYWEKPRVPRGIRSTCLIAPSNQSDRLLVTKHRIFNENNDDVIMT